MSLLIKKIQHVRNISIKMYSNYQNSVVVLMVNYFITNVFVPTRLRFDSNWFQSKNFKILTRGLMTLSKKLTK